MQTRRDQLQAYRFQNRRALAALVKGEPNVLEAPMRRLTVTTLSGILIAILIAAVFAALALFKPSSGDAWKSGDAVIIDRDSGADYVYLKHVLHPVINYPSAVLALNATTSVKTVTVSPGDIAGAQRGSTIGISDIPLTLPSASQLITSEPTVCSQVRSVGGLPQTKVSLLVAGAAGAKSVPAQSSLLVTSAARPAIGNKPADPGGTAYLLYGGERLQIGTSATQANVEAQLGLTGTSIPVGTAFLNSVPSGTPLTPPQLPGVGTPSGNTIDSTDVRVGQLVTATDSGQTYVMLSDGVGVVDAVEQRLLQTLPGPSMPTIRTTTTKALAAGMSHVWQADIVPTRTDLPTELPSVPVDAAANQAVCARYTKATDGPEFTIPPSLLSQSAPSSQIVPTETTVSAAGKADSVVVAPNHALVGQLNGLSDSDFLISDSGRLYTFSSVAVLAGFGYGSVKPTVLPARVVNLMPVVATLSSEAARRPPDK